MFNFFLKEKHMNVCKEKEEGGGRVCEGVHPVSLKMVLGK